MQLFVFHLKQFHLTLTNCCLIFKYSFKLEFFNIHLVYAFNETKNFVKNKKFFHTKYSLYKFCPMKTISEQIY